MRALIEKKQWRDDTNAPAMAIGAFNIKTRRSVAKACRKVEDTPRNPDRSGCAEWACYLAIGDGEPANMRFTLPERPATGEPRPVCTKCQDMFVKEQFPLGVKGEPGGAWEEREKREREAQEVAARAEARRQAQAAADAQQPGDRAAGDGTQPQEEAWRTVSNRRRRNGGGHS